MLTVVKKEKQEENKEKIYLKKEEKIKKIQENQKDIIKLNIFY